MARYKFMSKTRWDARFFESTRGQIILLLRNGEMTVNSLAEKLGLTDNAVRTHLLSLERDGLIAQKGSVKGFRKPHYIYGLTENARDLFPRPYGELFNRLLSSLRSVLSPSAFLERIRDVGTGIGRENKAGTELDRDEKLTHALAAIESLGGAASAVKNNGDIVISSESCPFAEAVVEHPEVCKIAESMIAEIVDGEVTETCDRTASPKCRFLIKHA